MRREARGRARRSCDSSSAVAAAKSDDRNSVNGTAPSRRRGSTGRAADRAENFRHLACAEHRVDLRDLSLQFVAIALGEAAGDDEARAVAVLLVLPPSPGSRRSIPASPIDEGARVDDEHVGVRRVGRESWPASRAMPSITSPSTRFLGQPSERKPIFIEHSNFALPFNLQHCSLFSIRIDRYSIADTDRLADVLDAADPGHQRSMPMPKPPCGTRAEAAQVEIPLEGFLRQVVLLDALHQQVVDRRCAGRRR